MQCLLWTWFGFGLDLLKNIYVPTKLDLIDVLGKIYYK